MSLFHSSFSNIFTAVHLYLVVRVNVYSHEFMTLDLTFLCHFFFFCRLLYDSVYLLAKSIDTLLHIGKFERRKHIVIFILLWIVDSMKQKTEILCFLFCDILISICCFVFSSVVILCKRPSCIFIACFMGFFIKNQTKPKKNLDIHPVMLQELESND